MAGALRRRRSPPETLPLEGTYTDNLTDPARPILGAAIKFAPLVTRNANPYASYALVANFAGVQNALRVKRLFNARHQGECRITHRFAQVFLFRVPNAVLARNLAAQLVAFRVRRMHNTRRLLKKRLTLNIVSAAINMQVAVTRMAERANEHVVLDARIMNKAQEFSDFIDGDHHVHFIEMLGFCLDYREKRTARRPYRRLVGWMLDNERIKGTRFFANFGSVSAR